ncbi:Fatty acyl-CoA elongase/Polyunsaturated fatty acid specific elongation enzyme [Entomophthora muscae]|uniref:Fatty acyl-CoA elongase/Polyunsaturated fatty acid specific elongation enzyme n=1 Tax=Entomophthora muscae TaxID=34485 RepID=A0ACC2U920_9FUNG|nr:Fatty acyl-CoA elongase/Polyunsaturated fatty acid specific elongation enzyme [Entomophthora muscae]
MELADTLFMIARKKTFGFLHLYHHSLTALLCYVQLHGTPPASYVPIVLNLGVHILMYWYYFLATFGGKIWWKKLVTISQIGQFVLDLIVVYFCTYTFYAFNHFPYLPNMGSCAGSVASAHFGIFLLTSYLMLFVDFFIKTYRKRPVTKVSTKKNGVPPLTN